MHLWRGAGARRPAAAYSDTDRWHAQEIATPMSYQLAIGLRILKLAAELKPSSMILAENATGVITKSRR